MTMRWGFPSLIVVNVLCICSATAGLQEPRAPVIDLSFFPARYLAALDGLDPDDPEAVAPYKDVLSRMEAHCKGETKVSLAAHTDYVFKRVQDELGDHPWPTALGILLTADSRVQKVVSEHTCIVLIDTWKYLDPRVMPPGGRTEATPGASQVPGMDAAQDLDAPPSRRLGEISFDSKGADFGPWLAGFNRQILGDWKPGGRIQGVVEVSFKVKRDGDVAGVKIIHSSGSRELNRTVKAVLKNLRLSPLPADYPDDEFPLRASFYYLQSGLASSSFANPIK